MKEVKARLKDILTELCEWLDIAIIEEPYARIMFICIFQCPQSTHLPRL